MHDFFARMIDAFRPAEGPPPRSLLAFFRWCLSGAWPGLTLAAVASALGGIADVVSAVLLGWVVDAVVSTPADRIWADQGGLILGFAAFFLLIRPAIFGLSTASSSVIIGPNILPLVLSRLHRWTMGHAVTFFDNDFAGRIAQKQMQTSRAMSEVVTEMLNTVVFALTSIIATLILVASIDWRVALILVVWLAGYLLYISRSMAKVRVTPSHWARVFTDRGVLGVYMYTRQCVRSQASFHARLFAPDFGIPEDPATGSAAIGFARVIKDFDALPDGSHRRTVEQGMEMGRPSLISLVLGIHRGKLDSVRIGGHVVRVAEGTLRV